MKLLFIISIGATILAITYCDEGAKFGSIESSIKTMSSLETRQESMKGCGVSSLGKCYGAIPQDGSDSTYLLEEIGNIKDAQTCQKFCKELYAGTCQWFMFDGTTSDCKLFSSPLNDLWNDCREVGYAREPQYDLCDQVFSANSTNGCYNFREDYCRFEFSLLENLEAIDSLSECQMACQYINNCSYFLYDRPSKICKLETKLSQKTCDIIHGTPEPDFNTCISGGKIEWASSSSSESSEASISTNSPSVQTSSTTPISDEDCLQRTTSQLCFRINDRGTCLTSTDSRSGFTNSDCAWCPLGPCTSNGYQCEPESWLRNQNVTKFENCARSGQ